MSTDERAKRFRDLRRRQDGVLSLAQAREAGYTRAAVAARVRRGEWVREAWGVLRSADHPSTPRSRIRVAMLSIGDGAGITGWLPNHRVVLVGYGPAELDLAFLEERVVVEVDCWAYRRDLRAFLRDATRQNGLVLEGWLVIRTNWFELTEDPETFLRTVLQALAARRTESVRGPS